MRFKDRTAIVAGASGGIGLAIAEALANEGANVIIWGSNEERLKKAEQELSAKCGPVFPMVVDITDYDQVQKAVDKVLEKYEKLDIMIPTVGGGDFKYFIDYTPEFWHQQLEYNITTVFNCFHVALKPMVQQSFGRLLCFISTTGGTPGLAAYGASKAACKGLMESISAEHIKDHVTANAILPGVVLTPFFKKAFQGPGGDERMQQTVERQPLGANTAENVARTALNILADDRLTGQVLHLR